MHSLCASPALRDALGRLMTRESPSCAGISFRLSRRFLRFLMGYKRVQEGGNTSTRHVPTFCGRQKMSAGSARATSHAAWSESPNEIDFNGDTKQKQINDEPKGQS